MAELMFKVPTEIDVKRDNRFVVEFPKEFGIESYFIQSIKKPSLVNGKWQNIEVSLFDPISPSMTEAVHSVMYFCKKNKLNFFSKKKCLFEIIIKGLDPTGVEVERWSVGIKEIVSIDFGSYDYAEDGIQSIRLEFKTSDCRLG